jgi:hypothetical protein
MVLCCPAGVASAFDTAARILSTLTGPHIECFQHAPILVHTAAKLLHIYCESQQNGAGCQWHRLYTNAPETAQPCIDT